MRLVGVLAIVFFVFKFVILAAFWIVVGPAALVRALRFALGSTRDDPTRVGAWQWMLDTRDRLIDRLDSFAWAFRRWLGRVFGLADDPLW
jgi:hypothetical protein